MNSRLKKKCFNYINIRLAENDLDDILKQSKDFDDSKVEKFDIKYERKFEKDGKQYEYSVYPDPILGNEHIIIQLSEVIEDKFAEYTRYIGKLSFIYYTVTEKESKSYGKKILKVTEVSIDVKHQKKGYTALLYKEFDKLYAEYFKSYEVHRNFWNPVAEYSYLNEIAKGNISDDHYQPENISRDNEGDDYTGLTFEQKQMIWTDLRKKLPDHLQGNEIWARLKNKFNKRLGD